LSNLHKIGKYNKEYQQNRNSHIDSIQHWHWFCTCMARS